MSALGERRLLASRRRCRGTARRDPRSGGLDAVKRSVAAPSQRRAGVGLFDDWLAEREAGDDWASP